MGAPAFPAGAPGPGTHYELFAGLRSAGVSYLVTGATALTLHGVPRLTRRAVWQKQNFIEPKLEEKKDYGPALKGILGAWNVCSKEWIIRQYDHEVQGASVLKPLVGASELVGETGLHSWCSPYSWLM